MLISLEELRYKEIISITDGSRYGFIGDITFDLEGGKVREFVVPGPRRFFGLLGRKESAFFAWESVKRFGAQTVLVEGGPELRRVAPPKRRW